MLTPAKTTATKNRNWKAAVSTPTTLTRRHSLAAAEVRSRSRPETTTTTPSTATAAKARYAVTVRDVSPERSCSTCDAGPIVPQMMPASDTRAIPRHSGRVPERSLADTQGVSMTLVGREASTSPHLDAGLGRASPGHESEIADDMAEAKRAPPSVAERTDRLGSEDPSRSVPGAGRVAVLAETPRGRVLSLTAEGLDQL